MGGIGGGEEEELNGISYTPSANEPAKDLILVHTVQLKPMIKAQISGRMVSSGISDVVFASVHIEKTDWLTRNIKLSPCISTEDTAVKIYLTHCLGSGDYYHDI